jgi:hypothetical protein
MKNFLPGTVDQDSVLHNLYGLCDNIGKNTRVGGTSVVCVVHGASVYGSFSVTFVLHWASVHSVAIVSPGSC